MRAGRSRERETDRTLPVAAISDTTARTSSVAEREDGSALSRSEKRSTSGEVNDAVRKQRKLLRSSSRNTQRVRGSVSVKRHAPVEGGERSRVHSIGEAGGVG